METKTNIADSLAVRELSIRGLALSVPEFRSRAVAAEIINTWFPGDQLALRSLHKLITSAQPLQAA